MFHNDWTALTAAFVALLCVSIPPAIYHVISQKAAGDDFFKQKAANDKMLALLDQIKQETKQELTELFAGGNNLYTNVSEIRKIVEEISLEQQGNQRVLTAKLDFIQSQITALKPRNDPHPFLQSLQEQTRYQLSTSQVQVEEVESLAASLQSSPAGSALHDLGNTLLEVVAQQ